MRILHTSDWHLGRVLHEHSLLQDQKKFLDDLVSHLEGTSYDALVISGDVFDRSVPPEEAVALWDTFLERFAVACPATALVAIAGNHDSSTRLAVGSRIIERSGIHIRGNADRLEEPITLRNAKGESLHIWVVPFLWSGSLTQQGDGEGRRLQTQEEALEEAIRRIEAKLDPTAINLLVAHCFAQGGAVSDSERTLVGTAVQVDTALFSGFDYVALGHLHRAQGLGGRMRYSGSPLAYSFSEAGHPKSMADVTLAKGDELAVSLIPVEPLRPMKDLKGTLEELQSDPRFAGLDNTYVRVSLTEPAGISQPVALLRKRFPFLLEFQEYASPHTPGESTLPHPQQTDLLDEFRAFERRIRGEAEGSEELVAAFNDLRGEMEKSR